MSRKIAPLLLLAAAWAIPPIPEACKIGGFAIGAQAWSFRLFTAVEAVEKCAWAGGKVIEFFPGQKLAPDATNVRWDQSASEETLTRMRAVLASNGVKAVSFGVVGIPAEEEKARPLFEFAKKMGIRTLTTESTGSIETIEKLAKEYDVGVGFHNHPRRTNDTNYRVWDPAYVAGLVKGRDPHVGASPDTGHWIRTGLDPLASLKLLEGRLISIHLKDLNTNSPKAHDVPYGTGVAGIASLLAELKRQRFEGNISIEYEYDWTNNAPEIRKCIDFVRKHAAVPR